MHMKVSICLVATLWLTGCATARQVSLPPAPDKQAPLAEREAYYDENRPAGTHVVQSSTAQKHFVLLRDGTRIDDPMALAQVVDADTPTARAAEAVVALEQQASVTRLAVWSGVGGGMMVMTSSTLPLMGLFTGMFYWDQMFVLGALAASAALMGGGAVIALTSLAFLQESYNADLAVERERMTAFLTYDQSLRKTLGLPRKTGRSSTSTPTEAPPSLLQGLEE